MSSFYDGNGQEIISKITEITDESTDEQYPTAKAVCDEVQEQVKNKQDVLVDGVNIKTINGESLLGSGDIAIESGNDIDILTEVDVMPTEEHTNEQVYGAKALDEFFIADALGRIVDLDYNPESANAQSGIAVEQAVSTKQDTLVSGTNIKTVNGESILGSGDIVIDGGNTDIPDDIQEQIQNKQDVLVSGTNIKSINGVSLLGSGNIVIEGTETDGVSSDVAELREEIKNSIGEKTVYKDITNTFTLKTGAYKTADGKINTGRPGQCTDLFAVEKGEKYRVTGYCTWYYSLIALYDENNELIKTLGYYEVGKASAVGMVEYAVPETEIKTDQNNNSIVDENGNPIEKKVAYMACSTDNTTSSPLIIEKEFTELNNVQEMVEETAQEIADSVSYDVTNVCPNGNFEDNTKWSVSNTGTSLNIADNVATLTNITESSTGTVGIKQSLDKEVFPQNENSVWFISAKIKVSKFVSACDIKVRLNGVDGLENLYSNADVKITDDFIPIYAVKRFATSGSSAATLTLQASFSNTTDPDFACQIKEVTIIKDIDNSYTDEEIKNIYSAILEQNGGYIDGTVNVAGVGGTFKNLGYNYENESIVTKNKVVTVGANGDFPTINSALRYLSKFYPAYVDGGIECEVKILDGTIINEQIRLERIDLSHISITTDNPDNTVQVDVTGWGGITHDTRGNKPFFSAEYGARLPCIKCLFSCIVPQGGWVAQGSSDVVNCAVGYFCNRGSTGVICGEATYSGSDASGLANVGFENFYDNIIANNNSEIVLREAIARNAGRYGVMARHISRVSARSADITNCADTGAYADRSSMMDVRFADVSGCNNGLQAFNTSNMTAVETIANNITNIVADSREGSVINCAEMTIDTVKDVFKVLNGGTVVATDAKLSNVTGTTYNVTTDIYTSNGTIYVTANKESAIDLVYNATSKNAQSGTAVAEAVATKQNTLVSGTNIKTVNGQSLLGSGNITIETVTVGDGATVVENSAFQILPLGKNLLNRETDTVGYQINSSNGELYANASYETTDFIPVVGGEKYSFNQSCRIIAFYDVNKAFLGFKNYQTSPMIFDDGVKYIRLSFSKSATDVQFEQDATVTDYEAFIGADMIDGNKVNFVDKSLKPEKTNFFETKAGGKNLLNRKTSLVGYSMNSTGEIVTSANSEISDFIPVAYGDVVTCSGSLVDGITYVFGAVVEYDENFDLVSYYTVINYDATNTQVTREISRNVHYIRVIYRKAATNIQIEFGAEPTEYEEFVGVTALKKEYMNFRPARNLSFCSNPWYGKRLVVDGDSITHDQGRYDYWQFVASEYHEMYLDINNTSEYASGWKGVGGSRIANENGTSTKSQSLVLRYMDLPNDADLVMIAGGTNDWAHNNVDLGDFDSTDNTTFNGALNELLPALKTKYPLIPVVMMTPIKRGTTYGATNSKGLTLEQFVDAMIAKCRQYGVYCLDMYSNCPINPQIPVMKEQLFNTDDDTHPNTEGHKVMGKTVAGFIRTLN